MLIQPPETGGRSATSSPRWQCTSTGHRSPFRATARPWPSQWSIFNSMIMSSILRFSRHSTLDVLDPIASAIGPKRAPAHIPQSWTEVDAVVYEHVAVWFLMALALHAEGLWKLYESGESVIQAFRMSHWPSNQGRWSRSWVRLDVAKPRC